MLMVRKVVLSMVATLILGCFGAFAQGQRITGTVVDESGAPVIGAAVVVEGTTRGTSTDVAGYYVIVADANETLEVSYLGYKTQKVAIAGRSQINLILEADSEKIEEVIVQAFGTAKKEAFTGSAKVIKSEDILKSSTTNALSSLDGKVSGVQMRSASGQPGAGAPSIIIRGFSSINAGTSPLIVLDGMPFDGSIGDINPADIASMTVLKDAASNALYGARGANGVIMITTKRATSNDAIVNVDLKVGVSSRAEKDYNYVRDPGQYYELHYKALYNKYYADSKDAAYAHRMANTNLTGPQANGGLVYNVYNVPAGQFMIGENGRLNPNAKLGNKVTYNGQDYLLKPDNWQDEVYGTGIRQEYNASVSGRSERTNLFASFGYLDNQGIVDKSNYIRYTARLKADFQAKKWLTLGGNVSYSNYSGETTQGEGSTGSTGNIFAFTSQIAPIYPLYVRDGDGNIMYDEAGNIIYDHGTKNQAGSNAGLERPFLTGSNAVAAHYLDVNKYNGSSFTTFGYIDITFLKDFKFTFNGSAFNDGSDSTNMTNSFYGQYASANGQLYRGQGQSFTYNLQQLLNYNKVFGSDDQHSLNVMFGHENYYAMSTSVSGNKSSMFSPDNLELGSAIKTLSASSSRGEYNNEGYFGRVQYDYDGRIFTSASYRRDASSRFHPDHRWGNFYSAGIAWLISREDWFNSSALNMLKIKASYGSQGNDNISSYLYTDMYGFTEQDGNIAAIMTSKGNPDITWETNANFNTGVEFGLWQDRLTGNLEYFYRKTTDMLSFFAVPPSLGYGGYYDNIGDMVNQGVELEMNATLVNRRNFRWDVNLNVTYVDNKIAYLADENKTMKAYSADGFEPIYGYSSGNNFYGEGQPLFSLYMPKFAGIDENGLPTWYQAKYRINDTNTDYVYDENGQPIVEEWIVTGKYSDATQVVHGTAQPDLYGGFGTSMNFFGFDLSLNFVYQIGGVIYDSAYAASLASPTSSNIGRAYHADLYKAWTSENPNPVIPRFQYGDQYNNSTSDQYLTDASYLSLQNINFGYTLPANLTSKFGVSRLRMYVACENVWLWSQRQGLDPRQSFTGGAGAGYYSPVRTISGGINVTF